MKSNPILSLSVETMLSVAVRIDRHSIANANGCIVWTGPVDRNGYGKINVKTDAGIRMTGAHRAAWLAKVGSIPIDLQIDHLCRTRGCVNTAHMELVTGRVNVQRSDHMNKRGRSGTGRRNSKVGPSGCREHGSVELVATVGNDGFVRRVCRPCTRERLRQWRSRQKQTVSGPPVPQEGRG